MLGGVVGVGVCLAGYRFILMHVPADLPHVGAFRIDWSVLVFALGLSAFTGVAFGLVPALAVSRGDLNGQLKDSNPRAGSEPHTRLRSVMAASQVSISLVLLIGAALTLESLAMLMHVRPGFDPEDLLTFHVSQRPKDRGTIANRIRYYDRAMARIRALPDVEHVGLISTLPFEQGIDLLFTIEGRSGTSERAAALDADFRAVSPGFIPTMHVRLFRGRGFSDSDNAGSTPVVIINLAMARKFWPDQNPIGQHVWIGKPMGPEWTEPWPREVVGVIGDIHGASLAGAPNPTMYVPYAQRPMVDAHFVIRTRQSPSAAVRPFAPRCAGWTPICLSPG